jgi:hypothetical protein
MSFDGGPAALTVLPCLIEIERRNEGFLAATDLFVGASSGAWTALYLARHLPLVKSGAVKGIDLLQSCLDFLMTALAEMQPEDVVKAWLSFAFEDTPLLSYTKVQSLMIQDANYGLDTLGRLNAQPGAARVVIIAGRMSAPWSPRVYDSADAADATELFYDVALRSGSFPMVFPIRDGQVDGAMYTNNPAMVGLVQALAGTSTLAPVAPADAIMLTLGLDDGSSDLSNMFVPGGHSSDTTARRGRAASEELPAEFEKIPAKLRSIVDTKIPAAEARIEAILSAFEPKRDIVALAERAVNALIGEEKRFLDEPTKRAMRQMTKNLKGRLDDVDAELRDLKSGGNTASRGAGAGAGQLAAPPPEQAWGWPQWMIYPLNFIFLAQVLFSSEGRGVGDQCARLLGARSLRLGPVTLLPTNEAAVLLLLGANELVSDIGDFTADLWAYTGPVFNFDPSYRASQSWVRSQWMTTAALPPA